LFVKLLFNVVFAHWNSENDYAVRPLFEIANCDVKDSAFASLSWIAFCALKPGCFIANEVCPGAEIANGRVSLKAKTHASLRRAY
jgi:hypothetical protein